VFGWLWAVAPPLVQLAVFHFVFTRVLPLDVPHFAIFLLSGILAWNWFSTGVAVATDSLETRRDLVLRPGFPTILLPVVAVLVALADYLVALPVLLVAVAFTTGLGVEVLLLPALLLVQLLLMLGLGWVLASAHVFFRDVRHLVGLALLLGFWLTPVFYSAKGVHGLLALVYDLNPLARLIDAQRDVLLERTLPAALPLVAVGAFSAAVFAAGLAIFLVYRHRLPEEL
jgi:lipopolysaccharide transport system permease protein